MRAGRSYGVAAMQAHQFFQLCERVGRQVVLDAVGVAVHLLVAEVMLVHKKHFPQAMVARNAIGFFASLCGKAKAAIRSSDKPFRTQLPQQIGDDMGLGLTQRSGFIGGEWGAPIASSFAPLIE